MKDIEKLKEYKAEPVTGPGTSLYDNQELLIERMTDKINEIIDYINEKEKLEQDRLTRLVQV